MGSYELGISNAGQVVTLMFSLDGGRLVLGGFGASEALRSLSDTQFSGSGETVEFVTNDAGAVTHALLRAVEGDFKAVRK